MQKRIFYTERDIYIYSSVSVETMEGIILKFILIPSVATFFNMVPKRRNGS